jgi:aminoglycoside 6'-N-acetyltransferase
MADLPLLRRWQARDHVRAWWEEGDPFVAADLSDPQVAFWIVSHGGRSFAFVQDYALPFGGSHPLDCLPPGSRGIDLYIGNPAMTGRGHGTALLRQHVDRLLAGGAPAIGIDPHPDNARAIATYRRIGFRQIGPVQENGWGLALPMALGWAAGPQSHPIAAPQRGSAIG